MWVRREKGCVGEEGVGFAWMRSRVVCTWLRREYIG